KGTEQWNNFLYNPVIILSYKLDPQYQGKTLNPKKCDSIIEDKLIRLVPSQDQENILSEYAEYVSKKGHFAREYLWSSNLIQNPINWWSLLKGRYPILSEVALRILSIPPTSAACERNWSTFGFIHNKLHNRLTDPKVEKYELNKNMDFVENLVNDNEDLEESVFDDLFSDNELITYDENGCIDICSDS
ncbi:6448_t:CDS:2, partial [Dentiscutata erythropus]